MSTTPGAMKAERRTTAVGTALLVDYFELIPGEVNSGAHQTRTQRNRMLLVPTGRDGLLLAYQSTW